MSVYRPVFVWTRAQRIIHWTIALSVLLLIPLGLFVLFSEFLHIPEKSTDFVMDIHVAIGFVFGAGIAARLIYLFFGSRTSNWRDVVPLNKKQRELGIATVRYYLSGFKGKAPIYFSHNPLAGLADIALFTFGLTQALSGLSMFFLHGEEHGNSHGDGAAHALANGAAHTSAEGFPEWVLWLHLTGAAVIIGFMLAHFAALALHDVVERRGLVSSMISGRKFFDEEEIKELSEEIKEKTDQQL